MAKTAVATRRDLSGRTVVVTGAGPGSLGLATARALARWGAEVVVTTRSVPVRSAPGDSLAWHPLDLVDRSSVRAFADWLLDRYDGRLDVLVNNAGVFPFGPFEKVDAAELDHTLAVHVRAAFVAAQAASPHLRPGGRIISIGSNLAERVDGPGVALYAMSKAALTGLTRGLARELGPRGITVNLVQPGAVDTDMNPADGPYAAGQRAANALDRFGTTGEVAALIAYLASDEAAYVTGAELVVDGGHAA
jgi:3-oxoacyl-[acyl-carrier protein] reductase